MKSIDFIFFFKQKTAYEILRCLVGSEMCIRDRSWTRLSVRKYKNQFSKREDPRGDDYYWLAGEAVLDLKSKGYGPKNWASDVSQIQDNKISLTPVEPDLFWRGNLEDLPKINNSFVNLS